MLDYKSLRKKFKAALGKLSDEDVKVWLKEDEERCEASDGAIMFDNVEDTPEKEVEKQNVEFNNTTICQPEVFTTEELIESLKKNNMVSLMLIIPHTLNVVIVVVVSFVHLHVL